MTKPNHFLILILSTILCADEYGNISTSRPGQFSPTSTVDKGLFQIEFGINSDLEDAMNYPTLTRFGLFNHFETQLAYSDEIITIGLMYGGISLFNNSENSIIFTSSLQKLSDHYKITDYNIYLPFIYSLSSNLYFSSQIATYFPAEAELESSLSYCLVLGGNINDNIGWFSELYGDFDDYTAFDAGIAYLLNKTMQFDFSFGKSMSSDNSNFIELGFSCRIPK